MSAEIIGEPNKKDRGSKFIGDLTSLLNTENTEEALSLIEDDKYSSCLEDCSSDIIPIVSGYLNSYNIKNKPELFRCCETMLQKIAETCDPAEMLLEFIEQAECPENDTKFSAVLKPMAISLERLKGSRGRSLEWCINTIKSHIAELPLPENQKLEGDEIILLDADPAVFRIVNVYQAILPFFAPFVSEVSIRGDEKASANRELVLSSLISLLGKPFCYLELKDAKSLRRLLADDILKSVTRLTGDLFRFLKYVEERMIRMQIPSLETSEENCDEAKEPLDLFAAEENISDLAYANFYYLILGVGLKIDLVPRVYHPHYVLHSCLYLSSCFLQKPEYLLISKGLALAQAALVRVDAFSIDTDVLELKVYVNFVQNLSQVMIYCDSRDRRETALNVFKLYFKIFSMEAKYLVTLHLYDVFNHSGLVGCLTSIVKDSVVRCLDSDPVDRSFTGKRIIALLTKACKMPFASSLDLVEISDEIIASLNLIRFLIIRDKTNLTGIWDYTAKLKTDFLLPLRDGLDISRAHYQLKIKDLEVQEKSEKSKGGKQGNKVEDKISITVGGETLPTMPIREKINFCCHAINAFDVMESILIRVNECIENRLIG